MVIVTGGFGFIGNELVRQLVARGEEVVILDNKNRIAPDIEDIQHVPLVELDITDHSRLKSFLMEAKPVVIFHLAAIHYIPECNNDPERTLRVNVEGTQSLLRAGSAAGAKKIIFASSGAVYGDSSEPLHETCPVGPVDIYGWSKLFGEQLCQLNYTQNGTSVVIARLFNNYGPRETNPHIIPEIVNQLRKSNQLKLGNISTVRDYIHTADCANALINLSELAGEGVTTVNVASGCGYTVQEIIQKISLLLGRSIDVQFEQSRTRRFDKQTQVANIALLKKITSAEPGKDIVDGLRSLLQFENLI